jgi:hypothetical protein
MSRWDTENGRPKKFYLTSLPKTRKALNKLINEFNQDAGADVQRFRALVSAFRVMVDAHRIEKEWDIELRLRALEEQGHE